MKRKKKSNYLDILFCIGCILAFSGCSSKGERSAVELETKVTAESKTETLAESETRTTIESKTEASAELKTEVTTELETESITKFMYTDLNDTELKNKVQEVAGKLEITWHSYYPATETFPEQYNMVLELGEEAIPYLLLYVQESENNGEVERFFVHCANQMLGLKVMIGNWESDFRVDCEYEMYSPKWYGYQLMVYYKEGRHETQSKDISEMDIFKDFTDAEMMNKVTEITNNNVVNNIYGDSFRRIDQNMELYKKFEALGIEALPYMLRFVGEFVIDEKTTGEEYVMQEFVYMCAYRLHKIYYGDFPEEYQVDYRKMDGDKDYNYELMSYMKDKGECK